MTKICECFTAKAAVERAVGMVKKQIIDQECLLAVAQMAVAYEMAFMLAASTDERIGTPELALSVVKQMRTVFLGEMVSENLKWAESLQDDLKAAMMKVNAAMDEEAKLPKGD